MGLTRRLLLGAAATLARPALTRAQSAAPIRIGEINSYATQPAFARPYRLGWEMAVAHVNDLGGLDGRMLEVIARDDGGDPAEAVRLATRLLQDDKADLIAGGYSSAVGLALSRYALSVKRLYVAGQPLTDALTWGSGNRYTYRIRPSAFELAAMLVEQAQSLPAKRWVTVAADDEDGRSLAHWFRDLLSRKRGDVSFVGEQWVPPGHLDAPGVASALGQPGPDAVFCGLFGADLHPFIRAGTQGGLFANRAVVAPMAGDPEYLEPLGPDTPAGWIVTGYPWSVSDEPFNKSFASDYIARTGEPPRMGSVIGYAMINAIVSGIQKAGGTDPDKMADGFADATFNTAFGLCRLRPIDHQATLGAYVGRLAVANGKGGMVDWRYIDGAAVLPPDDVVRQLRPA